MHAETLCDQILGESVWSQGDARREGGDALRPRRTCRPPDEPLERVGEKAGVPGQQGVDPVHDAGAEDPLHPLTNRATHGHLGKLGALTVR